MFLILFAGFRDGQYFQDYEDYMYAFMYGSERMEPSFEMIKNFIKLLNLSYIYMFFFYAFLGVSIKLFAIKELSTNIILSVLIYLSSFYLLHEMTQIRVGVSAGLLLLCIKPIYDRKFKKFLLFFILAFLFHYTALVIFPLYFINPFRLNKFLWGGIIPLSYLLFIIGVNVVDFIEFIPYEPIISLYSAYKPVSKIGFEDGLNVFNLIQLSKCTLAYIFLFFSRKFIINNKYFFLLLKVYIISVAVFPLFGYMPVLSFRFNELFGVVDIILIPLLIFLLPNKIPFFFRYSLPIGVSFVYLYVNIFMLNLIK